MKNLIFFVVILAFAVSAYSVGMEKFPEIWGTDNTSYVTTINPYLVTNSIYKVPGYSWELGTESGSDLITITCDIEMYLSMYLAASDVYFHIADNRTSMDAYINGWLKSNNGQWLFVSSELGEKNLDELEYVTDVLGRTRESLEAAGKPVPSPIPVNWFLKCSTDPDYIPGTASMSGNNEQLWGYTWLLEDGSVGQHNFTIKINIAPAEYQPDGRYEMDPVITASPIL
ncbi:hypothetical protein JXQ31_17320 [candidate division KSB1 bacterium]|nr:hypothetical protein [candidate division KSB1 bacterium]